LIEKLDADGVFRHAHFVREALTAVIKTTKIKVDIATAIYLLFQGIQNDTIAVWVKMNGVVPAGIWALEVKGEQGEVLFVYNEPGHKVNQLLDTVGIPWLQVRGAKRLIASNPFGTDVSERRMRFYGFTKREDGMYERKL